MIRQRRVRLAIVLFLVALAAPLPAGAQAYFRWVDERGVVHYTQTPPPAPPAPAEASQPAEAAADQYFLRVEGRAKPLERVSINGRTVVSGTLLSLELPVPVTAFLRDGPNVLEVEYTSDPSEGLHLVVERRPPGSAQGQPVATFSSRAGETLGKKAQRSISFAADLKPATAQPLVQLTEADRQALLGLVTRYYDAFARKDKAEILRLATQPEYPEAGKPFGGALDDAFKSPWFKMKPFQPAGIEFTVRERYVVARRPDGSPIFESERVKVEREEMVTFQGKQTPSRATYEVGFQPALLTFTKAGDQWRFAGLGTGPPPTAPTAAAPPPAPRRPGECLPERDAPGGDGWTTDLAKARIPAGPVSGKVHARAFTGERVEFLPSGSTIKGVTFGGGPGWFQLMLGQGKRFGFPDLGVALVIRLKPGESPEGKTFKICSDERGPIVHVTKRWKDKGKEFGDSDMFFNGYAVHLEFGRKKANTLPGRLYLALPDPERSFVAGTFDAEVATPTTAGAPGQPRPQR